MDKALLVKQTPFHSGEIQFLHLCVGEYFISFIQAAESDDW